MNILKLLGKNKPTEKTEEVKRLEKEVEMLKKNIEYCHGKLREKQEHINKTNAYWKNKMKELSSLKKRKY